MKRNSIYLLCLLVGFSFSSCNGYLAEENLSNVNSDEYFQEKDGFESLVNGCYATLRTMYGSEPWLFNLGVDIFTRGESREIGGNYENRDVYSAELNEYTTLDAQNGFVSSFWSNAYYGIQVCNTAINKVGGRQSESVVKIRLAEARFIRAYYYYLLVEQFGDIPLVTDEINAPVTEFTRMPEKEVYNFIISELNDVVQVLPAQPEAFGRASQGAAKHLLGLVHLTRGYKSYGDQNDFIRAAQLFDEVINGGQYSLQTTFADVYNINNQQSNEIIFSVQYDSKSFGSRYGGNSQAYSYGFLLDKKVSSGFDRYSSEYGFHDNQFMATPYLFSLFDTSKDSRYDATFKSEFYATMAAAAGNIKVGDLRLYFPTYDKPFTAQDSLDLVVKNPNVIIVPKSMWKQDIENVGGSGMCPMIWKFHDLTADVGGDTRQRTSTRDIFLFRLADTYLLDAEACLKAGNMQRATELINAVRERAALPGHKAEMDVAPADIDIDFILDERAREMAGEYNRWMDLKRTGKLIERTKKYNNLTSSKGSMDDHILVRPIPQSIIDQTTGYFPQNTKY